MSEPLLSVRDLKVHFPIERGVLLKRQVGAVRAVDGISFDVEAGETLGLVGESGCGKSTTARAIIRLLKPTAGSIRFQGVDLATLDSEAMRDAREDLQMIFQDPYASLNPRMTVLNIVGEPLRNYRIASGTELVERVCDLLEVVGLSASWRNRYPHEFSGGQRQRIGVARALALNPEMILCDEPVSALDVSVQAQVVNLLKDLQSELGLTYLFISHNLAVIDYMADRIAVMCAGRLVEQADRQELFANPIHPYTRALLAAVPDPDPDRKLDLTALMAGRASNPADWPEPFTVRADTVLGMIDIGGGHLVRASRPPSAAELAA